MAKGIERRSVATEVRADGEGKFQLVAQALTYGKLSQLIPPGFREQILPDAFRADLASGRDVKCLFNHNQDAILGRTANSTLKIIQAADGIRFVCQLNPESQQHRDLYAAVKRQDISECSFAMEVDPGGDIFEDIPDPAQRGRTFVRRSVRSAKLYDVSPVTSPCYAGDATSVAARAEQRAACAYVLAPPSAVVPPTTAELNAQIDKYHLKRALELGAEMIREAELRSVTHDFGVDDTVRNGTQTVS